MPVLQLTSFIPDVEATFTVSIVVQVSLPFLPLWLLVIANRVAGYCVISAESINTNPCTTPLRFVGTGQLRFERSQCPCDVPSDQRFGGVWHQPWCCQRSGDLLWCDGSDGLHSRSPVGEQYAVFRVSGLPNANRHDVCGVYYTCQSCFSYL